MQVSFVLKACLGLIPCSRICFIVHIVDGNTDSQSETYRLLGSFPRPVPDRPSPENPCAARPGGNPRHLIPYYPMYKYKILCKYFLTNVPTSDCKSGSPDTDRLEYRCTANPIANVSARKSAMGSITRKNNFN
jgi:hypothetical protein